MEDTDLAYFEKILLAQKDALCRKGSETRSELRAMAQNCTDPLDMAAMLTRQSCALQIQDREQRLIHKIGEALERIREREYGYCERCGEEIGMGRLKARPVTRHCMECKIDMENQKNVRFYNDAYLVR